MTAALDVLLIETTPGAGAASAAALTEAGHRVHPCHPATADLDALGRPIPTWCVAVTDGSCPIEDRGIDVALVAGGGTGDRPVTTPPGVTCAIRHSIPLVAEPTCTRALDPWIARRVRGDVAGACRLAADDGLVELVAAIRRCVAPTLASHDVSVDDVSYELALEGPRLVVTVTGPAAGSSLRQAIGVKVHDAVRSSVRPYRQVDVAYRAAD